MFSCRADGHYLYIYLIIDWLRNPEALSLGISCIHSGGDEMPYSSTEMTVSRFVCGKGVDVLFTIIFHLVLSTTQAHMALCSIQS